MVAPVTLQNYIKKCDDIISFRDTVEAEKLEKEIVSVLRSEYKGLTQGLDLYGIGALNGISQVDYIKDLGILKARLKKELDVVQPQTNEKVDDVVKVKKIFISHATKDKAYVEVIIKLLESLGFREDEIICSSIPPYCIPLDNNVYDWLANEFQHSDLHVIYALSKTYYRRPACLNEMGAAWALKQKWTAILLPGFDFLDITGCIDPSQVSIKVDDPDTDTLKYRLEELKDNLISEFGLRQVNGFLWERKRNDFLDGIAAVLAEQSENVSSADDESEELLVKHIPVVGQYDVGNIPVDTAFLLVYAAEGDGRLLRIQDLDGPVQIVTSGRQFMANSSMRESAKWQEALDRLIEWRWIRPVDKNNQIYELTSTGYDKAEWLKEGMCINTEKEPLEELKEFD